MDIENSNSIEPAAAPAANDTLTGPASGGQSVKAPVWMKTRPTVPPNEEQKPPKLGERMKHLSSLFASHTNELQWTMHRNTKCMLELCEKIHRKSESLSRSDETYRDDHDLDSEGKAKEKPFVHTSCRLKSPLSCNEMIRKDGRVVDIYAEITKYQQNGIRLLDELKQKLTLEVKNITREETKGLTRICALEYYETAFYLGGTLLLDHLERDVAPNSPEMMTLIHAVIGKHFMLFDEGETGEEELKTNGKVDDHLTGLPFITNVLKEAGGIKKDGKDAFDVYCKASGLISFENFKEANENKFSQDWDVIEKTALSLLNAMEALTTGLWKKIDQKKKDAKKAAKKKEFLGICKIDSANQKLDDAMEVDGEEHDVLQSLIAKQLDKKITKAKAKDKKDKRKNSSGSGRTHPQAPVKTGQSGSRDVTDAGKGARSLSKKKSKKKSNTEEGEERGRSTKRKPPRDSQNDEDSYHHQARSRSQSRPRRDRSQPPSILKNVRFQTEGRGRGGRGRGRGRGGRGGRGGAPSESRGRRGGRT